MEGHKHNSQAISPERAFLMFVVICGANIAHALITGDWTDGMFALALLVAGCMVKHSVGL